MIEKLSTMYAQLLDDCININGDCSRISDFIDDMLNFQGNILKEDEKKALNLTKKRIKDIQKKMDKITEIGNRD